MTDNTPRPGLWCDIAPGNFAGRAALFLDRDGVIIEDVHFLGRAEGVRVLLGAAEAIARCNRLGIPIVLVTNQSGIARGLYDWQGFHDVQAALAAALAGAGAHVDAVLACAYHPDGRAPFRDADHPWRKPNPGMMIEAAARMRLDLPHSWIVGDRARDIAAGRAAHLAGGILISADERDPEREAARALRTQAFAVEICASLEGAAALLFARGAFAAGLAGVAPPPKDR
jgi:D-glycero-D-manno-heptose 1,7-bisphosphate phosphatase